MLNFIKKFGFLVAGYEDDMVRIELDLDRLADGIGE